MVLYSKHRFCRVQTFHNSDQLLIIIHPPAANIVIRARGQCVNMLEKRSQSAIGIDAFSPYLQLLSISSMVEKAR